jgi:hypothetical protein
MKTTSILISILCVFFIACDNNSRSKQEQAQIEKNRIESEALIQENAEKARKNQEASFNAAIPEISSKVYEKIEKLGYKAIQTGSFEFSQYSAEVITKTPVKKTTLNYDSFTNTIQHGLEDKVYTMEIKFRKYNNYEITGVRLIDEGNNTYKNLE